MAEQLTFLKSTYGLTDNPFGARSGGDPDLFVGRIRERAAWQKTIQARKRGRGASLNFITGDYGYGKTLSLQVILNDLQDDEEVLGIYVKLLREDPAPKFGLDFIQRIFFRINVNQIERAKAQQALKKLPQSWARHARILTRWLERDELATNYLTGRGKLSPKELTALDLKNSMNSTELAKEYLLFLLYALRATGVLVLLVCVDEVEYLFSQMSGAKVANAINTLREIYDIPSAPDTINLKISVSNIVFFFGVTTSGFQNLNDLQRKELAKGGPVGALMSRKERTIELPPLSMQETEELIERRLGGSRAPGEEKGPLIPYTDDFVKYVYELTRGNPRDIIERCDYTLEDGLEQRVPKIDKGFAKKVFESHSLVTVPVK